jgi:hypothetical protein
MPISLSKAKRMIWAAISNRPPERNVIEYQCNEENFDVLYAATQIPQIKQKMKADGFEIRIVPNSNEQLDLQCELQMAQYALIIAASELSKRSDLNTLRWLTQLQTHAYNRYNNDYLGLVKILAKVPPTELLNYDPLSDEFAEQQEKTKVEKQLLELIRPETEKATLVEIEQLFNKLYHHNQYLVLHIDPVPAFSLVGVIQLALRHPQMDTELGKQIKDIALQLIDGISGAVPEARKYLEMGWHTVDKGEL